MKRTLITIMSIFSFFGLISAEDAATSGVSLDFDAPTKCARYSAFNFIAIPKESLSRPYDRKQSLLTAVFTAPSGKKFRSEGYYDGKRFVLGFVPHETGGWKASLSLIADNKNMFRSKKHEFFCYEQNPQNKGGIVSLADSDPLYLSFENNKPFFPVAMNLCWGGKDTQRDYDKWLKKCSENGINFIRIWMAPWSFSVTSKGLEKPDEQRAELLEKIIRKCSEYNIYVMLCLNAHGEFSETNNAAWKDSFYNSANKGPCLKPADFFTDKAAKNYFRDYTAYIVARFGAMKNVAVWELFNEADLTDAWAVSPEAVRKWHDEMARYIKEIDPHKRPVTTSFSDPALDDAVWKMKSIDITQTHVYGLPDTAYEIWKLSSVRSAKYGKPHLTGEFGIDTTPAFAEAGTDRQGIHVHNALWSGAFSMNCGTPMPWWWDIYIDRFDLYGIYAPLAEFIKDINWPKEDLFELQNKSMYLENPSDTDGGNVIIYPNARLADNLKEKFVLTPDGELASRDLLSPYLYGYSRGEKRSEPMIAMKNATPSEMTLKLKKVTGDNTLKVLINGSEAASFRLNASDYKNKKTEAGLFAAETSEQITVPVPQGDNEVVLSNRGQGTIEFEAMIFPGYLDPSLASVFIAGLQGRQTAYIWIKNRNYEWNLPSPKRVGASYLDLDGISQGRYVIEIYDTYSGSVLKKYEEINDMGNIRLKIPAFERDIALKVTPYKM